MFSAAESHSAVICMAKLQYDMLVCAPFNPTSEPLGQAETQILQQYIIFSFDFCGRLLCNAPNRLLPRHRPVQRSDCRSAQSGRQQYRPNPSRTPCEA